MTLRDDAKTVTTYLVERYKEGKLGVSNVNFTFKSSDIPLMKHNRVIGRVLKNYIATKGIIILWSPEINNHNNLWKTCFNGVP